MTSSALETFTPLFHPRSIAVVSASATSVSGGNRFIRNLKAFGFDGRIVPVHPSAAEIEGLPTCRSLAELGEPADYAYIAVAADRVPEVLRQAGGMVRVAQVMSSGFGEVEGGHALEAELVRAARQAGVRVIGPNCLGVYSPAARVTFTGQTSATAGSVGIVCQSGGLGIDILRRGANRGLRFSGLVTSGNGADVSPTELLEYFQQSDDTRTIGLYLEGIRDARRLFTTLKAAGNRKPVVILKGGRTEQGRRAAASHTGAIVGSDAGWEALSAQTGAVLVDTLDQFLDALAILQSLSPSPRVTRRVALFGNGGGTSVLGTDAMARSGFLVQRLPDAAVAELEALALPAGSSVLNPIDVPAGALQQQEGRFAEKILQIVCARGDVHALVVHINMTVVLSFRHVDMLGNLVQAALRIKQTAGPETAHLVLVLRSDGDPETEEQKRAYWLRASEAGIPVFDELPQAAFALSVLRRMEAFAARGTGRT